MKVGDRITVLEGDRVILGEVDAHTSNGLFRWSVAQHGTTGSAGVADENICWCRGWHGTDSNEVKAMRVARALGPSPNAMSLERAQSLYRDGAITLEAWKKNLDLWDAEFDRETHSALDRSER